jgi:hypothetical protein
MAVTEEKAEQIKKDAQAGMGYQDLAKKYKVNIKDLARIIKGEELKGPPPGKPTLIAEGLIDYTLTLPALAFAYFDMAKHSGLIKDGDMGFDEWVFECIDRRFAADYGIEIVMQPVASKKGSMHQMVKDAVKEVLAEIQTDMGKSAATEQQKTQ